MNSHVSRTYPKPKQEPGLKRPLLIGGAVLAASLVIGVLLAGHDEPKATKRPQVSQRGTAAQAAPVAVTPSEKANTAPVVAEPFAATTADDVIAGTVSTPEAMEVADATPSEPVTYRDAEAAFLAGDYALASDMFTDYAKDHPGNAWGHYMLGLSQRRAGDLAASESAFLACLAIDPDHVKALVNLGRVRLDDDRAAEAEEVCGRAVSIDPENVDAQRTLARALHTQGRRDEALAAYDTALSIDPSDAWSLNNKGLILIEEERFAEAAESLTAACAADDTRAVFHNNLGVALERTGAFADAEQQYAAALAIDAAYGKAAVSLARVEGKENVEEQAAAAPVLAEPASEGEKDDSGVAQLDESTVDAKPVVAMTERSVLDGDESAPRSDRVVPAVSRTEDPR
jgi:Flp pilus assembly protein TadD